MPSSTGRPPRMPCKVISYCRNDEDRDLLRHHPEPGEFFRVVARVALVAGEQPVDDVARRRDADLAAIPGRGVVDMIVGGHTAGAGAVGYDDVRLARQVPADMARKTAAVLVVAADGVEPTTTVSFFHSYDSAAAGQTPAENIPASEAPAAKARRRGISRGPRRGRRADRLLSAASPRSPRAPSSGATAPARSSRPRNRPVRQSRRSLRGIPEYDRRSC